MQEIRQFKLFTVSRRFSVAAGFYRTCVIDGLLEHSPAEQVRRSAVPAESPTLGFTHLQFEALLTAACESGNRHDFALVAMLGLLAATIRTGRYCSYTPRPARPDHLGTLTRREASGAPLNNSASPLNANPVVAPCRREAWCTAEGAVRRSGRRADPHLGLQHAAACRDRGDRAERPAALRWVAGAAAGDLPAGRGGSTGTR
jgi:hypothetical protein